MNNNKFNVRRGMIFIVDDSPDNLRVLSTTLMESGYEVRCAKNGTMALIATGAEPPDLILLDIQMPDLNGYEVCQKLKADEKTRDIPVIFLSAFDDVFDKVKAFAVGGCDYITKPFQVEEVLVRIQSQLALQAAKAEIRQLNASLEQRVQQRTAQLEATLQKLKREIDERQQTEKALSKSEEQFRLIFELAPIGMAFLNLDGYFLRVNKALCDLLGYTAREMLSKTWVDITHPDDLPGLLETSKKLSIGKISHSQIDVRYLSKNGKTVFAVLGVALIRDWLGKPLHFIAQIVDITERKRTELKIKASLKEKEILLKEIHHRVKNNLLIVSSLLDFQTDYIEDPKIVKMFEDSQHRIHSMALVHEKLYQSKNLVKINLADYIEALVDNLFSSYNLNKDAIQMNLALAPVQLNIETANPCGLIINELMTNSIKHAFTDGRKGKIWLSLSQNKEHQITLKFRDNGIGIRSDIDFDNPESLGLELVGDLTKQLKGKIELYRRKGTMYELTFSELRYRNRLGNNYD